MRRKLKLELIIKGKKYNSIKVLLEKDLVAQMVNIVYLQAEKCRFESPTWYRGGSSLETIFLAHSLGSSTSLPS